MDWRRDIHFQTQTTIDTLDYSSGKMNEGSKAVIAAVGPPRRALDSSPPPTLRPPEPFGAVRTPMPGVLAITGPPHLGDSDSRLRELCDWLGRQPPLEGWPLAVLVDDADFTSRSIPNFLWVVFTRSDPATDIGGVRESVQSKHWGCEPPLIIDARLKPHHAPELELDPEVAARVDATGRSRRSAGALPLTGFGAKSVGDSSDSDVAILGRFDSLLWWESPRSFGKAFLWTIARNKT